MTRAKSKSAVPTREPASKQRVETAVPANTVPPKPVPAKPRAAKPALAKNGAAPLAPAKAARAAVKAAPSKAAVKAAPALKTAPAVKATPSKAAVKAAPAKAVVKAALVDKAVSAKAVSSKAPTAKASAALDTPAKIRPIEQAVGVSSDAVARRTGKSWAEWFALLDAAGAAELDHKGIVAVLAQRHGVGPWWQQMVTVAYEQARGKNGKAATDDGFQVDVSKVLELPLAKLFRFWAEPAERNKWLADDRFSIHKATASKSIRARWGRGISRIDVDFCEKGPSKSQVTVQHNRIETSDAAEQMKAYWAKKIRALEALTRP
ncbi:MAG TPA: hypothetical protein VER04_25045 [Polyangiaceae bacterium]|nr:hypothetical protein [Polyangiaceae bacterium]